MTKRGKLREKPRHHPAGAALEHAASEYLAAGTTRVWAVYVEEKTVCVFQLDEDRRLSGTLHRMGDTLPGFTLLVRDIFPA